RFAQVTTGVVDGHDDGDGRRRFHSLPPPQRAPRQLPRLARQRRRRDGADRVLARDGHVPALQRRPPPPPELPRHRRPPPVGERPVLGHRQSTPLVRLADDALLHFLALLPLPG